MGLGKTIQSLYYLLKTPQRRPVLIVVPASLKWTWQAEAMLHFGLRAEVIEGFWKKGKRLPDCQFLIINYEILSSWMKPLRRLGIQSVVMDEVHFIKNHRSQRARACIKLCKRGPKTVLGLSGTPLTNRPIELWSVLRAIRPDLFPSRIEFGWRYCKPKLNKWSGQWTFKGAANTKELGRILREHVMIRRLKKDHLKELPPKTRRFMLLKMSRKDELEYHEAETHFIRWLTKRSPTRAERAKRSEHLTKVGYMMRLVAELKLNATRKWIQDFFEAHPEEKLVAFTMHTNVIDYLKECFPHAIVVNGEVKGRKRFEAVRQFQNNRRSNLLLGNWKAAGVGLTMTAAKNLAALDYPWTPGDLLQGEDRIHRIGQKHNVIIWYLAVLGTIEEKLIKLLRSKSKILDEILNGEDSADELNIFDDLLAIMKKETR